MTEGDRMDELERELAYQLQSIPSGGGDYVAYGRHNESFRSANLIRKMIETAVAQRATGGAGRPPRPPRPRRPGGRPR